MKLRFVPEIKISHKLLALIRTCEIVELPSHMYHGCQSIDGSVDIEEKTLIGNKWFSTNEWYAGCYAWHYSREENPPPNSRYTLELKAKKPYRAIKRPRGLRDFNVFLKSCYPKINGYKLSLQFQSVLKLHLNEAFGEESNIIGWYWPDSKNGDEICIPECHKHLNVNSASLLPDDKRAFNKLHGK